MRRGMSLVEVMIAATVLIVVITAMGMYQTASLSMSQRERDRGFAVQKTVQMMEEILALQAAKGSLTQRDFRTFADTASTYTYKLTTDAVVKDPANPLSGNKQEGVGYRFVRQILTYPMPQDENSTRVTVSVYYSAAGNEAPVPAGVPSGGTPRALATLTNIVRSIPPASQPTHVYDLYLIAIDNMLNWWADPEAAKQAIMDGIDSLQSANPGLEIRPHLIRRLAYGRDQFYAPATNKSGAFSSLTNWAYFYLGKRDSATDRSTTTGGPIGGEWHYSAGIFDGQRLEDGNAKNSLYFDDLDSLYNENQARYTYADMYNHAMRLPDEETKYKKVGGELTLRLLLEQLASGSLKNAIVVNLHGGLMPLPPIRNTADPARVPATTDYNWLDDKMGIYFPNGSDRTSLNVTYGSRCRLVTHPLKMRVNTSTGNTYGSEDETVELRVFPYLSDPTMSNSYVPAPYRQATITLKDIRNRIRNFNTLQSDPVKNIEILACKGNYSWVRVWPPEMGLSGVPSGNTMATTSSGPDGTFLYSNPVSSGNDIVIRLDNLDYAHAYSGSDTKGLASSTVLHGYKYFPDPSLNLLHTSNSGGTSPRNTCRFVIRFKLASGPNPIGSQSCIKVVTSIGARNSDDEEDHQFPNRSTTFVWVGQEPPFSEQYQFLGDPRHFPYKDGRANKNYNRFFGNFTSNPYGVADGSTFADTFDGYGSPGKLDFDAPRLFELWRQALQNSNAMFVNAAGKSFSVAGLGGEIYDYTSDRPYGGTGATGMRDEITQPLRLIARSDATWYAKPWLGELYPDNEWSNWAAKGNLPTTSSSMYRRMAFNTGALATLYKSNSPTTVNFDRVRSLGDKGGGSFFNGGGSGTASDWFFQVASSGGTADLTPFGEEIVNRLNGNADSSYDAVTPFKLSESSSSNRPDQWALAEIAGWRTKLELGTYSPSPDGYYTNSSNLFSTAPLVMKRMTGGSPTAYFMLNQVTPTDPESISLMGQLAMFAGIQGYMDLANPKYADASAKGNEVIRHLPTPLITDPAEKSQVSGTITVKWVPQWMRWDGSTLYSQQYNDADYTGSRPPMIYHLKYSKDGTNWYWANSNTSTTDGAFDPSKSYGTWMTDHYEQSWNVPNISGSFELRLEAYRNLPGYERTHYAYHDIPLKK